jgi:hypothetical protein
MLVFVGTTVPNQGFPELRWFFASIFIVGALSMILIQLLKDLLPLRQWFQEYWFKQWVVDQINDPKMWNSEKTFDFEWDLFGLVSPKRRNALYGLPVDQLCGQLNSAVRAALENPPRHETLFLVFASAATPADLEAFLDPPASLLTPSKATDDERKKIDWYIEVRNRVSHHAERAIDSLQVYLGAKWTHTLQTAALLLSMAFAFFGIGLYWPAAWLHDWSFRGVFNRFVIGLFAGYVAPVGRDILARLQRGNH